MNYTGTRLHDEIVISELVTLHYFEFSKDYKFPGEKHNFWEFVYVDKGELTAIREQERLNLKSGEVIFHKPNEWHSLIADGINASAAVVITFRSVSPSMRNFENRTFKTGSVQKKLLSSIIDEAREAFDTPLSELFTPRLHRRKGSVFGCEQMLRLHLTEFLLLLLRDDSSPPSNSMKRNLDSGLFGEIEEFLHESLGRKISLEEIARYAGVSKTAVKQLFREQAGCGACEYFTRLKIDRAKTFIRESDYNFTQIAELLGYDSIHYFSRQFKKYVNMSPTEYAGSIRALSNSAEEYGKGGTVNDGYYNTCSNIDISACGSGGSEKA